MMCFRAIRDSRLFEHVHNFQSYDNVSEAIVICAMLIASYTGRILYRTAVLYLIISLPCVVICVVNYSLVVRGAWCVHIYRGKKIIMSWGVLIGMISKHVFFFNLCFTLNNLQSQIGLIFKRTYSWYLF